MDWNRVRQNVGLRLQKAGLNPTSGSEAIGLSKHTLNKFLDGRSEKLSPDSVEKIMKFFGLEFEAELEFENPFDEGRKALLAEAYRASPHEVYWLLEQIRRRRIDNPEVESK